MIDCTKMEGMGLLDIVGLHVVGSVMSLGTVDFENRNFDHHVHHSFGRRKMEWYFVMYHDIPKVEGLIDPVESSHDPGIQV